MAKIETALAKLQAQRAAAAGSAEYRAIVATQNPDAAKLELPAQPAAMAHSYAGRLLRVDTQSLAEQKLLPPAGQERQFADQFRSIKRPLLRNAIQPDQLIPRGNLWMVTSALAGEGKTFTSINLSLSIAREKDWTVVLVDGDFIKAHLTRLFDAGGAPGFVNLLRDPSLEVDSLIMPTNVPGLSLLPVGDSDDHVSELLSSARMASLCDELASSDRRRIFLFDAPPLLLTAEAPVLATQLGQIIVVTRANSTAQSSVLDACGRLDPNIPVSLILNQASARESSVTAGGYYGYGYGE